MKHLTDEQQADLREELSGQLERLRRSMKLTEEAARPVELDQTAVGRLSRMDSLQNQGLTKSLQERERVRLAGLQEALARMEDGTYGICVACRAEIPFGRLYVFPEAPSCAACG
ncbi:MAG: TraR/DksA family transcriptional regulator [Gemmatimonadetes bacterium]|nr:TraR/DksA family transcriptional regulator [Gemmatimonadota bacterium]NIU77764.1 TraR/DksA family transcriptional regulator [Gammaproteobacteria bacterium]NIX46902.1 TraR/DksA family transcriptional regulator [Gemmatimonadota bacterium]NIY11253.1 TraR/DksA family transcriptional regulator [Gemmatimonadota bacterium]